MSKMVNRANGIGANRVHSAERSCSVFGDDDRFRVFLVPGGHFVHHLVYDQFSMARVAVPAVVAVYANHVQELSLPKSATTNSFKLN